MTKASVNVVIIIIPIIIVMIICMRTNVPHHPVVIS